MNRRKGAVKSIERIMNNPRRDVKSIEVNLFRKRTKRMHEPEVWKKLSMRNAKKIATADLR